MSDGTHTQTLRGQKARRNKLNPLLQSDAGFRERKQALLKGSWKENSVS